MESARAYLDWNASAPLRPEARAALVEALERFGNPSSPHAEGRAARDLLEASRDEVARFMGCEPREVVFTSGGTEANALALKSLAAHAAERSFVASPLEHPSVLRPLEGLAAGGWEARWLAASEEGAVVLEGVECAGFGCLQAANQETGVLQPLGEAAELFASRGVPWHCDAVQAWGRLPFSAPDGGAATVSLSGHKLGAPKGIGALYVRHGTPTEALLRGGPQERGRRAGTENVPGAAALAAACASASEDLERDRAWVQGLRDRLVSGVRELVPLALLNGSERARLPNTANLSFPGWEADLLVQALDLEGVAVSAGSACSSGALEPSEVLGAMGLPSWRVGSAVRVSIGPTTRPEEVDRFLSAVRNLHPKENPGGP